MIAFFGRIAKMAVFQSKPSHATNTSMFQDTATHARADLGKERPRYPSFVTHILPEILRIPLTAFWVWIFYNFVMRQFLGPWIYNLLVADPTLHRTIHETEMLNRFVWKPLSARMEVRGLDRNDVVLYAFGSNLVHFIAYVGINGCYMTFDSMHWFAKYRIPSPKGPPPHELIKKTLMKIAETFLISGPLASVYLLLYVSEYPHIETQSDFLDWQAPFHEQMLHFCGMVVFNHLLFYWAHRAFHQVPGAYRLFHKQHHQYQATVSISAEYAHPLEHVIANFMPTVGYNLLFSSVIPMGVWFAWLVARLHDTFETHSGYDFRGTLLHRIGFFCGGTYWHEYHHSKNRGNYGEIYLDWFFGTMDPFLTDTKRIKAPSHVDREW